MEWTITKVGKFYFYRYVFHLLLLTMTMRVIFIMLTIRKISQNLWDTQRKKKAWK